MFELSEDQNYALQFLNDWIRLIPSPYITMGGYAGTGKTTLVSVFRDEMGRKYKDMRVAFVSFTGKASRVLFQKLSQRKVLFPKDFVGTIHSLIYSPMLNDKKEIVGWEKKEKVDYDLIIIDEASMVNQSIWRDLTSYKIPIIAVGDHGQLPPIEGSFNLMEDPQIKLEKIHRQAEGNPIIQLSAIARKQGNIKPGEYGKTVRKFIRGEGESEEFLGELLTSSDENTLILCGYNNTRVKLNQFVRKAKEFESPYPTYGDRVICLRNNHAKAVFNGMLGRINSIKESDDDQSFDVVISLDDEMIDYRGNIMKEQFNSVDSINFTKQRSRTTNVDLFDFGYALTVHKAQGSQARRVVLFEERFKQMDDEAWRRWLYTGITRAEEELYIFGR